jgi:hypothetical protein
MTQLRPKITRFLCAQFILSVPLPLFFNFGANVEDEIHKTIFLSRLGNLQRMLSRSDFIIVALWLTTEVQEISRSRFQVAAQVDCVMCVWKLL